MITLKDWHEFLYECGLVGQQWMHVALVRQAYLSWRTGMTADKFKQEKSHAPHGAPSVGRPLFIRTERAAQLPTTKM
jgi:hypothetical protein